MVVSMSARAPVAGVILARSTSERFPRKHGASLGGSTLLEIVAARLGKVRGIDLLVAAIPEGEAHASLEDGFRRLGIPVWKGGEEDVAARFSGAAKAFGATWALRINGDCPFQHPPLLEDGILVARNRDVDFVTNIPGRTWPYGISLELVRVEAYERFRGSFDQPAHREHVTAWLYENPQEVRTAVLASDIDPALRSSRLVVDTPADLERLEVSLRGWDPRVVDALEAARFVHGTPSEHGDKRC